MRDRSVDMRRLVLLIAAALVVAVVAVTTAVVAQQSSAGHDVGVGGSTSGASPAASGVVSEPVSFSGVGAQIAAPPVGAVPAISSQDAINIVRADGIRSDVQAAIDPIVKLGSFTNTILGQSDAASLGPPKYLNTLVWDVTFPNAPQRIYGGFGQTASAVPDPCDLHVIVDAMTGDVIEGFQASCHLSGNTGPSLAGSRP
jgi:hypothetical protein